MGSKTSIRPNNWAWQAAPDLRRRRPDPAIPVMAGRERVTPQALLGAEQGLVHDDLPRQRFLLTADGVLPATSGWCSSCRSNPASCRPEAPA